MDYVREAKDLVSKRSEVDAADERLPEELENATKEFNKSSSTLADLNEKLRLCYETLDVLKSLAEPTEEQRTMSQN